MRQRVGRKVVSRWCWSRLRSTTSTSTPATVSSIRHDTTVNWRDSKLHKKACVDYSGLVTCMRLVGPVYVSSPATRVTSPSTELPRSSTTWHTCLSNG